MVNSHLIPPEVASGRRIESQPTQPRKRYEP